MIFKKKMGGVGSGGRVGGVRVDVNREVKFFVKIQKQFFFGGGGCQFGGGGVGGRGVRVDVNEELNFL